MSIRKAGPRGKNSFFVSLIMVATALTGITGWVFFRGEQETPSRNQSPNASVAVQRVPEQASALPVSAEQQRSTVLTNIAGMVVDTNGRALEGAELKVLSGERGARRVFGDLAFAETRSDKEGRFLLNGLKSGILYMLMAELPGYVPLRVEMNGQPLDGSTWIQPEDGIEDVKMIMKLTRLISGRVVDQLGQPVKNVFVDHGLLDDTGKVTEDRWSEKGTDEQGHFSISPARAGDYALWARYFPWSNKIEGPNIMYLGDRAHPLMTLSMRDGEWKKDVLLQLPLDPTRSVEGQVVDTHGNPVAGVRVWVGTANELSLGVSSLETPASGMFKVEGILTNHPDLPAEEEISQVCLRARKEGYEPAFMPYIPVGARSVKVILEPERMGAIVCHIYDALTGVAVSDAEVYLMCWFTEQGEYKRSWEVHEQMASKSGAFYQGAGWYTLDRVGAGTATIMVTGKGYGSLEKQGILVRPGETTEVDIPLWTAGMLCVHVVKPPEPEDGWVPWITQISVQSDWPDVMRVFQESAQPTLQCNVTEPKTHPDNSLHRDLQLQPGDYRLLVNLAVAQIEQLTPVFDRSIKHYEWRHYTTVTVESGKITSYEFDFAAEIQHTGSVEIDLREDWTDASRLVLISGRYDGFLERSVEESDAARWTLDSYLYPAFLHDKWVFPFVPPGAYTLVYYPHLSALTLSTPLIKEVTVTAGSSQQITLE